MKSISAVICELNPAHEGHKYIFERAREQGNTVIAVMSGNYVQRGETAVYDKYKRAEMALSAGADLVLELPFPWSASSAQYFSAASVSIAERVGAEILVFGSECGDVDVLRNTAAILSNERFNSIIPGNERAAEYRERLLYDEAPYLPEGILSSANDILGIEYIKNISTMKPMPFKRIKCKSASDIREDMRANSDDFKDALFYDKLSDLIYTRLRTELDPKFVTAESGGGVGERLYKAAFEAKNGAEMLLRASTKQYTNARLRRCGLFYLTDIKKRELDQLPEFSMVLAFNEKGRKHLSDMRRKSNIALITKPSSYKELSGEASLQVKKSLFADSIYSMLSKRDSDFFVKASPIYK